MGVGLCGFLLYTYLTLPMVSYSSCLSVRPGKVMVPRGDRSCRHLLGCTRLLGTSRSCPGFVASSIFVPCRSSVAKKFISLRLPGRRLCTFGDRVFKRKRDSNL